MTATEKLGITATLSGVHTIMTTENNIDCWSFTEKTLVKQNLGTMFKILLEIGRFTHYAFGRGGGGKVYRVKRTLGKPGTDSADTQRKGAHAQKTL